jgi:hypothetical protein
MSSRAPLLITAAEQAFAPVGVGERWAAVQELLHPVLRELAEQLAAAAAVQLPRVWPLYELSYKTQRYVNRGRGARAPIDEYHLAIDRAPRGSGVYIAVSGAERAVLVGIQLWGARKGALRAVWRDGKPVFAPLVERIAREGQARFSGAPNKLADSIPQTAQEAGTTHSNAAPQLAISNQQSAIETWLDDYLAARGASYLWFGFVYGWDDPLLCAPDAAERLVADALALLPFNEAIMEQAELLAPGPAAALREGRAAFAAQHTLPPADEIVHAIARQGFTYSDDVIRAYHVALQTRPLVVLPGISGTGKTRLTRLYADAVHGIAPGSPNPYYLLVAVQPDWHNARDLLGYFNSLSGTYFPTPFLRFLQRASADPSSLYFVCLDEMNLARPEYYLAPILSALETTDHSIDLGLPNETALTATGEIVANPFRLPLNLRISGTLNVDETTHGLSDKLLDRANVIELTEVDLPGFRSRYHEPVDETAWPVIVETHAIVARAGQPFGYRTIGEMLRYIQQARGVLPPLTALDLQLKQKVLPKLRGDDTPRLRRALDDLLTLCQRVGLTQSSDKIARMKERLLADGFTDFYG